ncbi:MAG: isoprenylcysteine carboxylmethyltransferase family protein [Planctomycetes bacterium]|nr:isoprenylcysteine carboxylmethyltransferase family protein [Planctomycetota bacterium]
MKFNQEKIGRICGMVLFSIMLLRQLYHFPAFNFGWVSFFRWSLVTILFGLFLFAYIKRAPAKELATKWNDVLLPFFCAALPFAIISGPEIIVGFQEHLPQKVFDAIAMTFPLLGKKVNHWGLLLMAFGEVITVIGMTSLKSSFSIATEARTLVTRGLYRYIRHPLYCGEILSVIGFALYFPCIWTIANALLFSILQLLRARNEENMLKRNFPYYEEYQKKTGFVTPKISIFFSA